MTLYNREELARRLEVLAGQTRSLGTEYVSFGVNLDNETPRPAEFAEVAIVQYRPNYQQRDYEFRLEVGKVTPEVKNSSGTVVRPPHRLMYVAAPTHLLTAGASVYAKFEGTDFILMAGGLKAARLVGESW